MNPEKLKALQAASKLGGKGTPRRKVKAVAKSTAADDQKLISALKKVGVQSIPGIEEVNFIKTDGTVLNFVNPQGWFYSLSQPPISCPRSPGCRQLQHLRYCGTLDNQVPDGGAPKHHQPSRPRGSC